MLGLGLGMSLPKRRAGNLSGLAIPPGAIFVVEGDNVAAQVDGRSLAAWMGALSNGRMTFPPNVTPGTEGANSHTLQQVMADVPGVLGKYPALTHVVIHAGRHSLTAGLETMKTQAEAIIDAYNIANVHVVWSCVLKATDAVGTNSTHEATRTGFNAWMAGLGGKRLTVVNHDANFVPASQPALVQAGGIYPTAAGARVIAGNIVAAMSFLASSHVALMPSANALTNAAFAGASPFTTGFTADSVVPTNWGLLNDTGATVKASVLDLGGVRTVELLGSGASSNAGVDLRLSRQTAYELPVQEGQWVEGGMFVDIANATGTGDAVGVTGWSVLIGDTYAFRKDHAAASFGDMGGRFSGFVRVPPMKRTSASNFQSFGFYARLATGTVDVRIRLWSPYACVAG